MITRAYHFAQAAQVSELTDHNRDRFASLETTLHKIRDTEAALYLYSRLPKDIVWLGPLYDFPANIYGLSPVAQENLAGPLAKDTLLVIDRRLALDDQPSDIEGDEEEEVWPDDKPMHRTRSPLESALHAAHRTFFSFCNRKGVRISKAVIDNVRPDQRTYRTVQFRQRGGADWLRRTDRTLSLKQNLPVRDTISGDGVSTFGYETFLPAISDMLQASCLCVFGMNGPSTLLCAKILSDDFGASLSDMVRGSQKRFVMLEFSPQFPNRADMTLNSMPLTLHDLPIRNVRTVMDVSL